VTDLLPTFDLRTLDLAGFRRWLDLHLARWASDPAFVQRARVRDLRRAHPDLRRLEADHRRAAAADAGSELGPRLQEVERQLYDVGKALGGLAEAILRAGPERRPSLEAKRDAFVSRQWALEEERSALTHASPERRDLLRATAALDRFRSDIGLDREEATLNELLTKRGRGSGRAGSAFEDEALEVARTRILPVVAADPSDVSLLQTVRLGAAGVELDIVVVRRPGGADAPVEVLAVVEAKRNANDLGHGFLRRQIDLGWLTGDRAAYDPAEHRTGVFDAGHFDRPAAHWQDGRPFVFAPGSFARFARDESGYFRDGLWLVTRAGPIWGLSGAALARVAAAVSTDEAWEPDDEMKLARLFAWARSLAGPVETPDVVRLYAEDPARARQLILLENAQSVAKAATCWQP
jgi:hypothetical protein